MKTTKLVSSIVSIVLAATGICYELISHAKNFSGIFLLARSHCNDCRWNYRHCNAFIEELVDCSNGYLCGCRDFRNYKKLQVFRAVNREHRQLGHRSHLSHFNFQAGL